MKMAAKVSKWVVLAVAGTLVLGLTGCGGDSEEAASADWLQQNGYEINTTDYLLAAEAGDLEAIELLREGGIAVDARDETSGDTALIRAAGTGQMEAIRHLLSEGAEVGLVNKVGRSALLLAAQEGHTEVVRLLLSYGADPAVKDSEGWNALTAAAYQGRDGVVEVLAGKMKGELDDAMLVASLQGHSGVVDQLLNRGAYVNTRSDGGQTPLMLAAKGGHLNVVQMLLQNGANPYALDRSDSTAAHLAKRGGHDAVAEFLLNPENGISTSAEQVERELVEASDVKSSIDGVVLQMPTGNEGTPDGYEVAGDGGGDQGLATTSNTPENATSAAAAANNAGDTEILAATTSITAAPASGKAHSGTAPMNHSADATPTSDVATESNAPKSPLDSMRMETYREKPLPVMLTSVEGETAEVRVLSKPELAASATSGGASASGAPSMMTGRPGSEAAATPTATATSGNTSVAASPGATRRLNAAANAANAAGFGGVPQQPVTAPGSSPSRATPPVAATAAADRESVQVHAGEMIAGTNYRVSGVSTKFVSSKEGKGKMVDVSEMTVEDTATGEKHMLVKNVPGRSADVYAVVMMQPGDQRYVVHEKDKFSAVNSRDQQEQFEVLEIRPTQVLIENLATRQVVTIERDRVAMQ